MCGTWALNSRSREVLEMLGHRAAIGCETVKSVRETDFFVIFVEPNSRRSDDLQIISHTAAIGCETVVPAKETIYDNL